MKTTTRRIRKPTPYTYLAPRFLFSTNSASQSSPPRCPHRPPKAVYLPWHSKQWPLLLTTNRIALSFPRENSIPRPLPRCIESEPGVRGYWKRRRIFQYFGVPTRYGTPKEDWRLSKAIRIVCQLTWVRYGYIVVHRRNIKPEFLFSDLDMQIRKHQIFFLHPFWLWFSTHVPHSLLGGLES
jgi:hypothetical protein